VLSAVGTIAQISHLEQRNISRPSNILSTCTECKELHFEQR
jgi:hypothetical protein